MGNEAELTRHVVQGLDDLQAFLAHPIGIRAIGSVVGAYALISLANFLLRFEGVRQAKNHGMTGEMMYRLNLAIVLFIAVVALGAFLKLSDGVESLTPYNIAYQPLQAVLAVITVGLLLFNYGDMITNAFDKKKEYKTSLAYRLCKLYEVTSKRGVNVFELLIIPIAFFIPWLGVLNQLSQSLR